MRRTQIYLDEDDAEALDRRARAEGTTRSRLIRRAIEAYLGGGASEAGRLARFRAAVGAAAGAAPDLPPGGEYVAGLRAVDAERQRLLDERRGR